MQVDAKIQAAALALRKGELVVFPTETVYGLGANALDPRAIASIFETKRRPRFNPLIVHVASLSAALPLICALPEKARRLIDAFWPGPLTLVLPKSELVPEIVTAGLSTVAIRVPAHPIALDLLTEAQIPVAAPSANLFQQLSPTEAVHITAEIHHKAAVVLEGGKAAVGVESTIIGFSEGFSGGFSGGFADENAFCLRLGGLALELIEDVIGPLSQAPLSQTPLAPGMLEKHYSPRKPLRLWRKGAAPENTAESAILCFQQPPAHPFGYCEILSSQGDVKEAAAQLFSALRKLDGSPCDVILCRDGP